MINLQKIIISLLFINNVFLASDCPSGCGPVEHIFSKKIAAKYAEEHLNSGLNINHDNENVPTNIVEAAIAFGLNTKLIDKDGNSIIPEKFQDTQTIYLPMFRSSDFMLKKSIVGTIALDDLSSPSEILTRWNKQYNLSNKLITKYKIKSLSITEDGIIICQPCSKRKEK